MTKLEEIKKDIEIVHGEVCEDYYQKENETLRNQYNDLAEKYNADVKQLRELIRIWQASVEELKLYLHNSRTEIARLQSHYESCQKRIRELEIKLEHEHRKRIKPFLSR